LPRTDAATASDARVRLLAVGGLIGPVAFVSAWVGAGAATADFSGIDSAISDLARVGASTRVGMTTGFVLFGIGVVAFGLALRDTLPGPAWMAAVATATCTLGVAATPLGGWSGDAVHAAFAGAGYATLVALPLLASAPLARAGRAAAARLSIGIGVVAGACLVASTLGPAHGLWQRLGLTVGDVWIVSVATRIAASSDQAWFGTS
jgi:hypothetical membrane protein